ncbi:MAG: hypothetical protein HZB33_01945 [Nitrospirae bacterium]|nr:hypothetical protein [Nitrospirota bacterium]
MTTKIAILTVVFIVLASGAYAESGIEVNGDLKIGGSGVLRFPDGTYQNSAARMIYGTVGSNGTIYTGTGFSVTHTGGTGGYLLTFAADAIPISCQVTAASTYDTLCNIYTTKFSCGTECLPNNRASVSCGFNLASTDNAVDSSFQFLCFMQ